MTDTAESGAAGGPRRYFGKYAALVVDNAAPESGAHRGQVLISVPGILEEGPDGTSSQPMQVLAAPSFLPGFFFIPEVDAQVWVEFVAGDINFPIWTGVWYPGSATPQTFDDQAPTEKQKLIRTASGNVVQLDDTSGSEKIVVKSGNGTVTMDGETVTIVFGNGTVVVKDSTVEVQSGTTVKVTLDSSGGITVEGGPTSKVTVASDGVSITDTTGAAQPVVLAPLIDWLLAHKHVGNMGAPTPLDPGDLAALTLQKPLMTSKA